MRLTGAPCSPVIPLRPPAGFWLPREPAAAFSLIVASGGWAPIFPAAVPPGFPNTAVGPPRPSGNLEAIFLPLSFPSPPVLAVGPADPPAGFWLPSKPTAAFSLIVAPSN